MFILPVSSNHPSKQTTFTGGRFRVFLCTIFIIFQLASARLELEDTDRELGKSKAQVKLLENTIQKRQHQLDALDRDVEKEVQKKRDEIKVGFYSQILI